MLKNINYDLEERTTKFSKELISLCKKCRLDTISKPIVSQLVRSGTSVGANYSEANGASSKKDFRSKIFICKKESKETMYWLRLLAHNSPSVKEECLSLWKEAKELTLIFSAIAKSSK
ncbi:four helix bundle protein [Candidatus Woesebacteria bacterium RIFCSPHIGHO2_01_FULL_44_21]|uniref:Four helix bundle protein n=1 Tax=Candidatus Woesebacteria bacterium RIFCSPHIGHO2_01_FULL_44_21 TaxID=1802503 RepID=A0A1F7YX95_9BACT|nr:MAG: four helix bundle protein [Candidatus Woesebacteria bacterium RIFCSPHIGHO2_01_FULL_44_21]OGM69716.1 MAG: four helix bundle protein [Candidatus Woesebacteria bacterium RIFCSPLOWO2_01_FULL_44_24b]